MDRRGVLSRKGIILIRETVERDHIWLRERDRARAREVERERERERDSQTFGFDYEIQLAC